MTPTRLAFGACVVALLLVGGACSRSSSGEPYALPPQPPDRPVYAVYNAVTAGYPTDAEPRAYGISWSPTDGVALQLGASPDDSAGTSDFIDHTTIDSTLDRIGRSSPAVVGCTRDRPSISGHLDGWFYEIELLPTTADQAGRCSLDDATRQTLTDAMASLRFTDFHGWFAYAEASRPSS